MARLPVPCWAGERDVLKAAQGPVVPEWLILSTGLQGKVPGNVSGTFIAVNAYGDLLPLHLSACHKD